MDVEASVSILLMARGVSKCPDTCFLVFRWWDGDNLILEGGLLELSSYHCNFLIYHSIHSHSNLQCLESIVIEESNVEGPLHFSDTRLRGMKIEVAVDAVAEAKAGVEASQFQESSFQYQFVEILESKLEDLRKRKLLDPQPSYMKQYWRSRRNLYVVTMIVELLNSPVLRDISSGSASGGVSSLWNSIKVKAEGKFDTGRGLELSLQKGMVMAYKKKLLVLEDDSWDVLDDPYDMGKSFPEEARSSSRSIEMKYDPHGPCSMMDFECMTEEVSSRVRMVALLSRNIQGVIFVNIQAMLGDRQALQDLMDTLEQEKPLGHLSGPGATILDELGRIPGYLHVAQVNLILYLLEAIMVLSDTQHALLAQSMEKRILLHQRELVRSILEPNFNCPGCIPFTLDPQLLAPLQDEGVAITYGLLQECGLRMELNDPQSTWDLEAKEPLSALYMSLCLLQQLSEA
ncbi:gasdermin-C-like [Talpa occidentalis]|uniref:gasdermin-C-like n=1 Tax=Talpa occidentalis TaxID=50954 RepID=UPI0023F624C4|nr:gasdermin-C-like [Talpa occidentalis]